MKPRIGGKSLSDQARTVGCARGGMQGQRNDSKSVVFQRVPEVWAYFRKNLRKRDRKRDRKIERKIRKRTQWKG